VTDEVVLTDGTRRCLPVFEGEWTEAVSRKQMPEKAPVRSVVFPIGVTAIGKKALDGFEARELVLFPAG
jgi:hypothetical protein